MRIIYVAAAASLALGLGVAGTAAMTAPPAPAKQARALLLPLSERDLTSTKEMGCTCTMEVANRTFVQAIGNELMLRTRAGRQVCRLTDARFQQISGATGTYNCGGTRMTLRKTGRSRPHPESDSVTSPAVLTAAQGRARQTLNGTWGCAC